MARLMESRLNHHSKPAIRMAIMIFLPVFLAVAALIAPAQQSARPAASQAGAAQGAAGLLRLFQNPPDDCRIMMRWWWFGPAVTKAELEREMKLMKEGGHRRIRGAAGLPARAR